MLGGTVARQAMVLALRQDLPAGRHRFLFVLPLSVFLKGPASRRARRTKPDVHVEM